MMDTCHLVRLASASKGGLVLSFVQPSQGAFQTVGRPCLCRAAPR